MPPRPDPLPADLADALDRSSRGRLAGPILYFTEIGSTNDVAAALAAEGREGAIVIADAQTSGRGRRGHTWFSPPGAGLYISVVLTPGLASHRADRATMLLTLTAGLALSESIQESTGLVTAIKWPNDLLCGRRKLCGILAEGVSALASPLVQAVVLGYGVNVSPAAYPPELANRATSLESELGRPIDRALVCAATLAGLAARYDDLIAARYDAILEGWRRRAPGIRGARVAWEGAAGPQAGVTAGVDDDGALLVRSDGRLERIVSGEVRWM